MYESVYYHFVYFKAIFLHLFDMSYQIFFFLSHTKDHTGGGGKNNYLTHSKSC